MAVTAESITPHICRARRRLAGLTVDELAARAGWPAERIALYEAGSAPALSTVERGELADALERPGVVDE